MRVTEYGYCFIAESLTWPSADEVLHPGTNPLNSAESLTKHDTLTCLGQFDCIIATNVLNFIYDYDSAVHGLALMVKQSGVCLCTVAGLCQVSRYDYDRWGDYWRFNDMSIRKIFERYFDQIEVMPYGNAPLAASFVMGLSQEDVPPRFFEICDPDYQILITVKASSPKIFVD
ncbi:hypothetical protein FNV82_06370 [Chlorobium phaeovibrioides]|nr:hypothetical protein FNV82_06370 [Chlorobium phaeovibrioides]